MKKYLPLLKTPEAASVMIHMIILLVFALVVIKPQESLQWHSFEWQSVQEDPGRKGTPSIQKQEDRTQQSVKVQERMVQEPSREPVVRNETPPTSKPAESDLIDPLHHPDFQESRPLLPNMTRGLRHIQSASQGSGQIGGDGDFGDIIDSDDVEIVHRVKPDVEVKEFGSVTLTFRLRSNGTVDPFSIIVLGFDRGLYGSASEDALKKWRFRFKGRYNPNKVYQITFKFIPQ